MPHRLVRHGVEEALAGSVTAAQGHLQRAKVQENLTYDQDLLIIAQELVRFQQAPPGQRTEQFGVSRRRLSGRFSSWRLLHTFKDVRRTFGRAAGVFVHSGGGWRAKLWFGWKLNWQWTLAPLAPMAVVLGVSTPVVLIGLLVWWAARRADAKSRLLH